MFAEFDLIHVKRIVGVGASAAAMVDIAEAVFLPPPCCCRFNDGAAAQIQKLMAAKLKLRHLQNLVAMVQVKTAFFF